MVVFENVWQMKAPKLISMHWKAALFNNYLIPKYKGMKREREREREIIVFFMYIH